MNDQQKVWLVMMGLVPYEMERCYRKGGRYTLKMNALFWNMTVSTRHGRWSWRVEITIIRHLQDAIWTIVAQFKK